MAVRSIASGTTDGKVVEPIDKVQGYEFRSRMLELIQQIPKTSVKRKSA